MISKNDILTFWKYSIVVRVPTNKILTLIYDRILSTVEIVM